MDGGRADGLCFKLFHEQVGNQGANGGFHGCTMELFKILTLEQEVAILRLQQGDDFLDSHGGPVVV